MGRRMRINIKPDMRTQVHAVVRDSGNVCSEYAFPGGSRRQTQAKPDLSREREKMKEMLLPFVKEAVKKQLKEERDYYRSRPSMAARQLETVFGRGNLENVLVPALTLQVWEQVEERMRHEWIRKGR